MNLPGLSPQVPTGAAVNSSHASNARAPHHDHGAGFGAVLESMLTGAGRPPASSPPESETEPKQATSTPSSSNDLKPAAFKKSAGPAKSTGQQSSSVTMQKEGAHASETQQTEQAPAVDGETEEDSSDSNKDGKNHEKKGDASQPVAPTVLPGCTPIVLTPASTSPNLPAAAKVEKNSPGNTGSPEAAGKESAAQASAPASALQALASAQATAQPNQLNLLLKNAPAAVLAPGTNPKKGATQTADSKSEPASADDAKLQKADSGEVVPNAKAIVANAGAGEAIRTVLHSSASSAELRKSLIEHSEHSGDSKPSESIGTGVAPHGKQMLRAEQQNEIADLVKQNLPDKADTFRVQAQPVESASDDHAASVRFDALTTSAGTGDSVPAASGKNDSVTTSEMHPVVGRLVTGINHEAMILRQFKPDKLDVVLRPDANTQISLQLRLDGSDIQGTARCERGDFHLLSTHWGELQRTMDQQGVRLGPLKDSGMTMAFSNGNSFGNSSSYLRDQRGRRLEEVVTSEPELAARSAASVATAVRGSRTAAPSRSLLQTWA